jgi:gliding motility-associated-like protein
MLIVDDACGRDTMMKVIDVFLLPSSNYTNLCTFGDIVIPVSPVSGYLYKWYPSYGLSDSLIANPEISIKDTLVKYAVMITDENTGCSIRDTLIFSNMDISAVDAGKDTVIVLGESVILKGCCGPNYQWYPMDFLSNPLIQYPIATPERDITYFLSVSQGLCTVTDSVTIKVERKILIPNLITPGDDGLNDQFKINGLCKNSPLEIYNTWGELVFKTDNYQNDWNGETAPAQIYYYIFTESCTGKCYRGWLQVFK